MWGSSRSSCQHGHRADPKELPQGRTGGNRPEFLSVEYPSVLGEPGISEDTAACLCCFDKPVKSWSLGQEKRGVKTGMSAAVPRGSYKHRGHEVLQVTQAAALPVSQFASLNHFHRSRVGFRQLCKKESLPVLEYSLLLHPASGTDQR